MLGLTYRTAPSIEDIDKSGVGIVLLVDLEALVITKQIVEERNFIFIHRQAYNIGYIM